MKTENRPTRPWARHHLTGVLATISALAVLLGSGALAAPAQATTDDIAQYYSARPDSVKTEKVELDHNVDVADTFKEADKQGIHILSAELLVGNGGGLYQYDPNLSASKNAESLQSQIKNLTGTSAVVTALEVLYPPKKGSQKQQSSPSATAQGSAVKGEDQVRRAFAGLDETDPTDDDISRIRDDVENSPGTAESHMLKPQANGVPAETNAHPNNVSFRTDDNVGGKRKVTYDIQWMDKSDIKNAPDGWGLEVELYQYNYKLSDVIQRPACPKGTDEKFWADAGLHGTTITYLFNNKKNSSAKAKLEPYLDNNHWSDPCYQGGIGVGFGKPKTLPRWDETILDTKIHQRLTVAMSVPKGNAAWSHIGAASSFVAYNCQAKGKADTDCMGQVGIWPEDKMGGISDMLLLNKNRKWKTPTYFSWSANAVKRPAGLPR
ncbi:hypothetical protein A2T55_04810 [Brevibacterium linens]|uniref:Uncharacterized protein n=1 Tax=Brevibacterium linens TaxID=1703 RepID=A0A142NK78_BRELN|nr:hypothetical protein [Brevibacterium linens]AMT93184.1 hypothetical protein A2T55_04810 [Brevibacterium linens]